MQAELVMIGSELLLGQNVDTNATYLAQQLADLGLNLFYKTTVGDNLSRMVAVLRQALDRSEVVITSGGLGPTEDDLTREAVAQATGRTLEFVPFLYEQIEERFRRRNMTMSPNNRRQAFLPQGAIPVENPRGTAPAFIVEQGDRAVLAFPGVPGELKYLFEHDGIPYLRRRYGLTGVIRSRVLHVTGLTESEVDHQLADLIREGQNPTIGLLAHIGDIHVRVTAKADSEAQAAALIEGLEGRVRARLGDHIFGVDAETLEGTMVQLLERVNQTMAVLEEGVAGLLGQRLAGTGSERVRGILVNPAPDLQARLLDISAAEFEALQEELPKRAERLAAALRRHAKTDLGVALLVHPGRAAAALDSHSGPQAWELSYAGLEPRDRQRAVMWGLERVRRHLLGAVRAGAAARA